MTELEYKELNKYLNDVCMVLSRYDGFLLTNIEDIARLNDTFFNYIKDYEIKEESTTNNLTYNDVYLITREIIESIDKKYLELYDGLIESGQLEFIYEKNGIKGTFQYINQDISLINIEREFNYSDVVKLVHEFFHYTNMEEYQSINRYILTEFISIYFEMYARDYLLEKGIPKEEINVNDRLKLTLDDSKKLYSYDLVLLAFNRFGNIDENTINFLNKYISPISKEEFEEDCKKTLDHFKKVEIEYKKNNYKNDYNYEDLKCSYAHQATSNYKYILGTLFAIYVRKYSSMEQMIHLNDTIGNNTDNFLSVLNDIGIDMNKPSFHDELLVSLDEYVSRFNNKKEKQ